MKWDTRIWVNKGLTGISMHGECKKTNWVLFTSVHRVLCSTDHVTLLTHSSNQLCTLYTIITTQAYSHHYEESIKYLHHPLIYYREKIFLKLTSLWSIFTSSTCICPELKRLTAGMEASTGPHIFCWAGRNFERASKISYLKLQYSLWDLEALYYGIWSAGRQKS